MKKTSCSLVHERGSERDFNIVILVAVLCMHVCPNSNIIGKYQFKQPTGFIMRFLLISLIFICNQLHADTIDNYMSIATNIPQMELKADPQAQAWARSARHVLTITCESIAETL